MSPREWADGRRPRTSDSSRTAKKYLHREETLTSVKHLTKKAAFTTTFERISRKTTCFIFDTTTDRER